MIRQVAAYELFASHISVHDAFPHTVRRRPVDGHEWRDLLKWCREQFGLELYGSGEVFGTITVNDEAVWDYSGDLFYFLNPDDAVFFKLRWG